MAGGPPVPQNILRGHRAQVHTAVFLRDNERLATGDADGFVVLWDLTIARPRAVWKAHENSILSIRGWGRDKIITHGRDLRLVVWQLSQADEARLSVSLPLEDTSSPRPHPWLLHTLEVNTMNFCAFAACSAESSDDGSSLPGDSAIHVAVPNTLASDAVDIYSLPSQERIHTVRPGKDTGMAMSLALLHLKGFLALVAAFENGYATVQCLQPDGSWSMTYRSQAHSQPVLSLDIHPSLTYFLTSSADAIIAKHPIPTSLQEVLEELDPNNRIIEEIDADEEPNGPVKSLLSEQLKTTQDQRDRTRKTALKEWSHPLATVDTKHAGQQGLCIRPDGRIFATAGWDANVRVYSSKTMKELAVLQWHKVGCYAVAFADVSDESAGDQSSTPDTSTVASQPGMQMSRPLGGSRVKDRRIQRAKMAHWIAAGAKDGKVSLWDIY